MSLKLYKSTSSSATNFPPSSVSYYSYHRTLRALPVYTMASQQITPVPTRLVAFPSVSSSLHSLPHATSMANVSLHSSSNALRAAESEAKLQKALNSKAASSPSTQSQGVVYGSPSPSHSQESGGLMMRSKSKYSS